jgi:heme-degrading monooxygenase HmoA
MPTVAVIRARLRPGIADEYYPLADRMGEIARAMPGFISWKVYHSDDGERVSIHEWESPEQLKAWREHPEHRQVQKLGREKFYEEYTIYVADSPRESRFKYGG